MDELDTNIGYAFEEMPEMPEMPESLSEPACHHWNEVMPVIFDLKSARPADNPALIILCEAMADLDAMQASIRQDGFTHTAPSGAVKGHPALRGLEVTRSKVEHLLNQFDLMPSQYRVPKYADYLKEVEWQKKLAAEREAEGDESEYE